MKKAPVVSVIMPLYNKRPYVRRAIDSVCEQTFTDWECIIIDDGSTDGSVSEIPTDDGRIRFFQQKNAGPAAARNRGIGEARGELVAFLDADDYYYPQKLQEELSLLYTRRKAEWMMSPGDTETNNEIMGHRLRDHYGRELPAEILVLENAPFQSSLIVAADGLCIRKKLLERVGGFNEEMRCFEIAELVTRCSLVQPKVITYPFPLYCVVKLEDSAFAVSSHRIDGLRQLGESFLNLSKYYPQFSDWLTSKSRRNLHSYVVQLRRTGRKKEARRYLTDLFPYARDKEWWKQWLATWQPEWLFQWRMSNRKN